MTGAIVGAVFLLVLAAVMWLAREPFRRFEWWRRRKGGHWELHTIKHGGKFWHRVDKCTIPRQVGVAGKPILPPPLREITGVGFLDELLKCEDWPLAAKDR